MSHGGVTAAEFLPGDGVSQCFSSHDSIPAISNVISTVALDYKNNTTAKKKAEVERFHYPDCQKSCSSRREGALKRQNSAS